MGVATFYLARHQETFDLIHCQMGSAYSATAIGRGRMLGKPSVLRLATSGAWNEFQAMRSGSFGVIGRVTLPLLRLAARVVVLNPAAVGEATAWFGPNRVVFAAGRLDRQKGFDLLVRACVGLAAPQVVIAGEGDERAALERLARDTGVRLRLLGKVDRDRVDEWMRAASVVVAPSRGEGMSNVVLEALALGCPVIASEIPGNLELVENGVSGVLMVPDDAAALQSRLSALLDAPIVAAGLGKNARRAALTNYTVDAMARRYETIYRELVDPRKVQERSSCVG